MSTSPPAADQHVANGHAEGPTAAYGVRPTARAPALDVALVDGGRFVLANRVPERFTMLVFNRGLHCPVCRAQLSELSRRSGELAERGIELVSISGETEQRATRMRDDWGVPNVPLAYGLAEERMRAWGLFVSRGTAEGEPPVFNEPAIFLVKPDQTVYYEALLSMPVGRPHLDDLLGGLDHWKAGDYQPRGGA